MIPKAAIEKAIEGGWKTPNTPFTLWAEVWQNQTPLHPLEVSRYWQLAALDPAFWQAIGKELGWGDISSQQWDNKWKTNAHLFYDLILTGGDTEAFWKDLLAS